MNWRPRKRRRSQLSSYSLEPVRVGLTSKERKREASALARLRREVTNLPVSSSASKFTLGRAGVHADELETPSTSSSRSLDVRAQPVVSPGSSSEVTFVYVGDLERPSTSLSGSIAAGGTQPQYQSCIQGTSTRSPRVSRDPTLKKCERLTTIYFQKDFREVEYGVACSVC